VRGVATEGSEHHRRHGCTRHDRHRFFKAINLKAHPLISNVHGKRLIRHRRARLSQLPNVSSTGLRETPQASIRRISRNSRNRQVRMPAGTAAVNHAPVIRSRGTPASRKKHYRYLGGLPITTRNAQEPAAPDAAAASHDDRRPKAHRRETPKQSGRAISYDFNLGPRICIVNTISGFAGRRPRPGPIKSAPSEEIRTKTTRGG
jgi:hypothetical protein